MIRTLKAMATSDHSGRSGRNSSWPITVTDAAAMPNQRPADRPWRTPNAAANSITPSSRRIQAQLLRSSVTGRTACWEK